MENFEKRAIFHIRIIADFENGCVVLYTKTGPTQKRHTNSAQQIYAMAVKWKPTFPKLEMA